MSKKIPYLPPAGTHTPVVLPSAGINNPFLNIQISQSIDELRNKYSNINNNNLEQIKNQLIKLKYNSNDYNTRYNIIIRNVNNIKNNSIKKNFQDILIVLIRMKVYITFYINYIYEKQINNKINEIKKNFFNLFHNIDKIENYFITNMEPLSLSIIVSDELKKIKPSNFFNNYSVIIMETRIYFLKQNGGKRKQTKTRSRKQTKTRSRKQTKTRLRKQTKTRSRKQTKI